MKLLLGLGISFSHSDMTSTPGSRDDQFSQSNTIFVYGIPTDLAFKLQSLFLGRFREFPLKSIFLPAITALFPSMAAFSLGQGSSFSGLVKRD
jgi:hypothetical protein